MRKLLKKKVQFSKQYIYFAKSMNHDPAEPMCAYWNQRGIL